MTIFSIHARPADARLEAVPDRFSWLPALLPPVYALVHGLWLGLLLYVIAVAAIVVAEPFVGAEAAVWLYVLLALLCGFEAAALRRAALARRGYTHDGECVATAEDAAAATWLGLRGQPR